MIAFKRLALVIVGVIALPLAGHADQVCDFEHRCYEANLQQHYHMDLSHPDVETPPPAPQYSVPAPSAVQGRSITVQPNGGEGCRLFRIRSVPTSSRKSSKSARSRQMKSAPFASAPTIPLALT